MPEGLPRPISLNLCENAGQSALFLRHSPELHVRAEGAKLWKCRNRCRTPASPEMPRIQGMIDPLRWHCSCTLRTVRNAGPRRSHWKEFEFRWTTPKCPS